MSLLSGSKLSELSGADAARDLPRPMVQWIACEYDRIQGMDRFPRCHVEKQASAGEGRGWGALTQTQAKRSPRKPRARYAPRAYAATLGKSLSLLNAPPWPTPEVTFMILSRRGKNLLAGRALVKKSARFLSVDT